MRHAVDVIGFFDGLKPVSAGFHAATVGDYSIHTALQPIYTTSDKPKFFAVEALVRPFSGVKAVSPFDFFGSVPEANETIVDWQCLALHLSNIAKFDIGKRLIFININPKSSENLAELGDALKRLVSHVAGLGLDPSQIVFEITEQNVKCDQALAILVQDIRRFGCKIAVDDFGEQGSDIMRVRELRPDFVKISRIWFTDQLKHDDSFTAAQRVLQKFKSAGSQLLIEGIETPEQMRCALACNAGFVQGFLLKRPTRIQKIMESSNLQRADWPVLAMENPAA